MQQVVQFVRNGKTKLLQLPEPLVQPGHLLIQNEYSVISAGTEKMIVETAGKSLLQKARSRPDLVRQVFRKLKTQGLVKTFQQVSAKLDEPVALGYSSAGTVLACGEGVQGIRPGDRVASNGCHAGTVCVPKNLCAVVPENVTSEHAAFAVIGSIALQGIRLARLGLGDTVLVIGLGLIGQAAVNLLKAHGCRVLATDLDAEKCRLAEAMGAEFATVGITPEQVRNRTRGYGADAVLVTAATSSNAPVELAGEASRSKGRVVVVGAVGLGLPRTPYYNKEVEFIISCSYGPGRYDVEYEQRGHDYPIGYVRWTEQRNMQAVLDLMANGKFDVAPLISHRFAIDRVEDAYEMIKQGTQPYLGIVLNFDRQPVRQVTNVKPARRKSTEEVQIGCIGTGSFAKGVLLPALKKIPRVHFAAVTSARGMSAAVTAQSMNFASAVSGAEELLDHPGVNAVLIATRHNEHANQVIRSLRSGKHTFVEKPLAITLDELASIESTLIDLADDAPLLMVGFNRRFSPSAVATRDFFSDVRGPLSVAIRFNAGSLPASHWTQDAKIGGGRIIGEACHAIDLATFLVGSPVVRVFAESVGGPDAPSVTDDQCFITLRHANGSLSNVAYLSSGSSKLGKERVEVFGGGKTAVIDDFREVVLLDENKQRRLSWHQDKGHLAEMLAFVEAIRLGRQSPISWAELWSTSAAAILAVRSLREGVPQDLNVDHECLSTEPHLESPRAA